MRNCLARASTFRSKHARAYPIHALGFELLNDTLGDVPIAASW